MNAERIFSLHFKYHMNDLYINLIKKQMVVFRDKDNLLLCFLCFISKFYILFPNLHFDQSVLQQ